MTDNISPESIDIEKINLKKPKKITSQQNMKKAQLARLEKFNKIKDDIEKQVAQPVQQGPEQQEYSDDEEILPYLIEKKRSGRTTKKTAAKIEKEINNQLTIIDKMKANKLEKARLKLEKQKKKERKELKEKKSQELKEVKPPEPIKEETKPVEPKVELNNKDKIENEIKTTKVPEEKNVKIPKRNIGIVY
jgi:hypothetical protein